MRRPPPRRATFTCPNCGEQVPTGAAACPHCGSDKDTGWSDDTEYDGLDLPGDDDEPADGPDADRHFPPWTAAVALVVLIAIVWLILKGAW